MTLSDDQAHAQLVALVKRQGLEAHLDAIAALARPASRAVSLGPDDYAQTGGTRFGGDPDLPSSVVWPRRETGLLPGAAVFIAQIDLATLPYAPPGLPHEGLLSLFVQGTDAANVPVDVHAFHFPRGTPLARRRSPPAAELCDEYLVDLRAIRVTFEPTLSIADVVSSGLADALGDRWEALNALRLELHGVLGRVGGHARDHGDEDLRLSAVLEREGHAEVESVAMFDDAARLEAFLPTAGGHRKRELTRLQKEAGWWFENRARVLAECERWHCVLRIDSNEAMGLMINDADPLFFLASEVDLTAGRFDRIVGRVLQG
jgi:hypothetical protein